MSALTASAAAVLAADARLRRCVAILAHDLNRCAQRLPVTELPAVPLPARAAQRQQADALNRNGLAATPPLARFYAATAAAFTPKPAASLPSPAKTA